MVGVSRLIRGYSITSPLCNPEMGAEKEKSVRRKYMEKALELLQSEGKEDHSFVTI